MSGKGKGSKSIGKPKCTSMSSRAGLQFPVGRIARFLRKGKMYAPRVTPTAAVCISGVLEYLAAQILELAGNAARDNKRWRINPRHVMMGVRNDEELDKLWHNVTIPTSGALSCIHPEILKQSRRAKKSPNRNKNPKSNIVNGSRNKFDVMKISANVLSKTEKYTNLREKILQTLRSGRCDIYKAKKGDIQDTKHVWKASAKSDFYYIENPDPNNNEVAVCKLIKTLKPSFDERQDDNNNFILRLGKGIDDNDQDTTKTVTPEQMRSMMINAAFDNKYKGNPVFHEISILCSASRPTKKDGKDDVNTMKGAGSALVEHIKSQMLFKPSISKNRPPTNSDHILLVSSYVNHHAITQYVENMGFKTIKHRGMELNVKRWGGDNPKECPLVFGIRKPR